MIRSAAKLGFFGVLVYFFARTFWSLFSLLAAFIGSVALLGCFLLWFYFAVTSGWLPL